MLIVLLIQQVGNVLIMLVQTTLQDYDADTNHLLSGATNLNGLTLSSAGVIW